ncbi:formate/nitrite transporter family protein [[Pseudomonas] carboxydohydrogena]|jgi:formate transporter|uniref:Formate/nitrite transporter family protein n=1 Tax=Afipia carboxydohydrogena TaxID=290 RepID=A0ABY8BQQ4_AFICR|nr:formate/nitrite transporter family protein [[Pseudomonas] carboxydohydrogena]RTL75140.1 MAG: formate/nitrite transporter family protein [Bradyrhizobiaceae bacterium]WEF51661.1 formate/nitrite transporter family protein [[Pseudomonas] carboxydohydrogena]
MGAEQPTSGRTTNVPPAQYLDARHAIEAIAMSSGRRMLDAPFTHVCVMAAYAGALIALGALFSVLLSAGVDTQGPRRLLEGLGFSAGFFFVIQSQAALFTEINVVMPVTLLHYSKGALLAKAGRFWVLAFVANLVGALAIGYLVPTVQSYPPEMASRLAEIVSTKMAYREIGGINGWIQAVLSGMLANWLVGLAAFFATMGRTIIDRFVPVFLAVSLFVAAGFQHSPANMAYFSLAAGAGMGPGWGVAMGWSILPAALGNLLGGFLLVTMPLWISFGSKHSAMIEDDQSGSGP